MVFLFFQRLRRTSKSTIASILLRANHPPAIDRASPIHAENLVAFEFRYERFDLLLGRTEMPCEFDVRRYPAGDEDEAVLASFIRSGDAEQVHPKPARSKRASSDVLVAHPVGEIPAR